MNSEIRLLKEKLREINDLKSASRLLSWDQATYMPDRGAPARARQQATLERLAHMKFVDPQMGETLQDLFDRISELPPHSDDAVLIRRAHEDYMRIRQVPPDRMAALIEHGANTFPIWAKARAEDNFKLVEPELEKMLELSREIAGYFTGFDHIADGFVDIADPGMRVADIRQVFSDLRRELVPFVEEIRAKPLIDDSCLHRFFPEKAQMEFGLVVVKRFGFDPERCRQDKTHHPFMTKFSLGDVRITTRYDEKNFSDGFFSTLHETGHALYEMGLNPEFEATPLDGGTSAGAHESQSRMWENVVGRSREFWEFLYPQAQAAFPEPLGDVSLEQFYRAINKVHASLIRTEADEVTYNLHVMIRFDLEVEMLEGKLAVRDLPEAWRARYQSDLGASSPTDANGVLQDVHWYAGNIGGAFQGYTLGNLMAAQFFEAAVKACPDIREDFRRGNFENLHAWLKENIYRHGRKYTADELLRRVTGRGLDNAPLMRYLRSKYGAIFGLN